MSSVLVQPAEEEWLWEETLPTEEVVPLPADKPFDGQPLPGFEALPPASASDGLVTPLPPFH